MKKFLSVVGGLTLASFGFALVVIVLSARSSRRSHITTCTRCGEKMPFAFHKTHQQIHDAPEVAV